MSRKPNDLLYKTACNFSKFISFNEFHFEMSSNQQRISDSNIINILECVRRTNLRSLRLIMLNDSCCLTDTTILNIGKVIAKENSLEDL